MSLRLNDEGCRTDRFSPIRRSLRLSLGRGFAGDIPVGGRERVRSAGDDGLVHAAVAVSDRVAGSVQARDHLAVGVEYLELVVAAHARGGAVEVVGRLLDGVAVVPQIGVEHVIEIGYCHARSAR